MSAELLLSLGQYWLIAGALTALVFLTFGIDRIDEDARDTYVFRPLLVPGVLLIWPFVLWRWLILERGKDAWPKRHLPERRVHTAIWSLLCVVLPLIVVVALANRQTVPSGAPVQLEAEK